VPFALSLLVGNSRFSALSRLTFQSHLRACDTMFSQHRFHGKVRISGTRVCLSLPVLALFFGRYGFRPQNGSTRFSPLPSSACRCDSSFFLFLISTLNLRHCPVPSVLTSVFPITQFIIQPPRLVLHLTLLVPTSRISSPTPVTRFLSRI